MGKRILSLLMVLALCLTLLPASALAEEPEEAPEDGLEDVLPVEEPEEAPDTDADSAVLTVEETYLPDADDLPDSDELFAGYVMRAFYGDSGVSLYGDYGATRLEGLDLKLYTALKTKIEAVANGKLNSTQFTLSFEDLGIKTTWTKAELGVSVIWTKDSDGKDALTDEVKAVIGREIAYDGSTILDCLRVDCPYDLYWYNKTQETTYGRSYKSSGNSEKVTIAGNFVFSLPVSQDYAVIVNNSYNPYIVDTNKTSATSTAVANARAIVQENEGKCDYAKLLAYKDAICELVDYNRSAADEDTNTPYGDPWQLIHVFDDDHNNQVVCEGYSKAFQYLCDMSTFTGNIACYTVTGTMKGGTGEGPHMWNIVTMEDGENYLVDVTNSDQGSIGQNGGLFLAGASGSVSDKYVITVPTPITYIYDDDTTSLYGNGILTLASENYKVPITSLTVSGLTAPVTGEALDTSVEVTRVEAADGKTNLSVAVSDMEWDPTVSDKFDANTAYTATLTLTAPTGYQFIQGTTDVTVSGVSGATERVSNDGTTLTIEVAFPETAGAALESITVTRASGTGDIPVPVKGEKTTVTLTATATYDDKSTSYVTNDAAWSVEGDDTGVSVVYGTVTITPEANAGTVTITATYQGKTDSITLNLTKDGAGDPASLTVKGDNEITSEPNPIERTYTVTGENKYGETITLSNVTWSVDPTTDGLSIDRNGKLTIPAGYEGNVTVKASTSDERVTGTLDVSITRAASVLTSVTLDPSTVTISGYNDDADRQTVSATARDQYGKDITSSVTSWSVAEKSRISLLSVDTLVKDVTVDQGTITVGNAANAGTYTVTAVYGGKSVSAELTVTRAVPAASGVTVTSNTTTLDIPVEGEVTATFTATVKDQYEETISSNVAWTIKNSAGEDVTGVSIDTNGVVTVTAAAKTTITDTTGQTFTITATVGEKTDTATLTVKRAAPKATTVTLSGGDTSIEVPADGADANTSTAFTATVKDQYGADMTNANIQWSITSDTNGVTISNGVVTVTNAAKADINSTTGTALAVTATVGGVTSEAKTITVKRAAAVLTSVAPAETTVNVSAGEDQTVQFKALDQYGTEITSDVAWTIAEGVSTRALNREVTIKADTGAVTVGNAAKAGAWTVTATYGDAAKTATLTITRTASAAGSVAVSGGVETMEIPASGSTKAAAAFQATVKDQYDETIDAAVAWTITDKETGAPVNGVTIDESGYVTVTADAAKTILDASGKTFTVTAASGSASGSATLTIKRAASVATSIQFFISGSNTPITADTVGIPNSGDTSKTYTAKVYDQYGADMAEATPELEGTAPAGITVTGGAVTVASTTEDGASVTLKAVSGEASATLTVTAKTVEVNWGAISAKSAITYGDAKTSAFTPLPETGTATAYVNGAATTLKGTFSIVDADTLLPAGENQTITVQFTVDADGGAYAGNTFTRDYTVAVSPKPVTAVVTPVSREYGAKNPVFTATCSGLAGTDTVESLGLDLTTAATETSVPGAYDVTGTASNANYTVTVDGTGKLTVTKAALTLTGTAAGLGDILANDARNASAEALLSAVQTANPTLAATSYANGTSTLSASWALTSGTWDAKGGSYTYTATLTPTDSEKFSYSGTTAMTVEVKPVNATLSMDSTSVTKVMTEVSAAADYTALGLPAVVHAAYDNSVTAGTYAITGWSMTLDQIKAEAAKAATADQTLTLTPSFTAPAWATLGNAPTFTLTITAKYPVQVTLTAPSSITYGETLTAPAATQAAMEHGTDNSATFIYTYKGTTADGKAYESTTAPTAAGTYTVTASLDSLTHSGTATSQPFTIAQKEVGLTWTDPASLTYDGAAKTVTVTATGLVNGDTCDVTVSGGTKTDAGSYTATATGLSSPNYKLPAAVTHSFTIAKANRDLTVTPATLGLVPNALTGTVTASYADLDKSAEAVYSLSGDTTAVSYKSNSGTITAVGNGTVTLTVTIAETGNYNAASATVAVTALAKPVTGITSVTSDKGDTLTGAFQDGKVVVSGTLTEGAALAVTPELASVDGLTASSDGTSLTVKLDGREIASYPIDVSAVVKKAANVEIKDGGKRADNKVTGDKETAANTAITDAATKVEDLAASAAKALQETAQQLESSKKAEIQATTADYTIKVEVSVAITAKELTEKSFKVAVTPTYKVTAVDNSNKNKTVVLEEGKTLPNGYLTTPATVSVKLPDGFSTANLFAKHYLSSGRTETLRVTVTGGVATWQQSSFSEVELFSDARTGSVAYTFADGTTQTVTYDAADIGKALPTDTKSGYTFSGWKIGGKNYTALTGDLLDALNNSSGKTLTAEASFTQTATPPTPSTPSHGGGSSSSVTTYPVTVDSGKHGSVTTSARNASKGTTVTITVKPDDGYQLDTLRVTDKNGDRVKVTEGKNGKFTFTMPASKVTVEAVFAEIEADWPFTDVADDFWARDAIAWAYENGYMNGVSATTFNPDGSVTRQQLWMILARLSGQRPADMAEARAWAMDNGVSDGTNPGNAVSRQQMVTILYRYAAMMGYKTSGGADLGTFPDSAKVAAYAQDAMSWSVGNGIVGGTAQGTLNPAGTATRAQFATILQRFYQNIVG